MVEAVAPLIFFVLAAGIIWFASGFPLPRGDGEDD